MDVTQEKLRRPLVLLVAAGRAEAEIGLAVAQHQAGTQGRARPFARRQARGHRGIEPEHLRPGAETEAQ
jgi:hypothetical protein